MMTTSCLLKAIMCKVEQLIDVYAHHPQLDKLEDFIQVLKHIVLQHIQVPPTYLKIRVRKTPHQVKFI